MTDELINDPVDDGQLDPNVADVVYSTGPLLDGVGRVLEGPREVARLRGDGVAVVLGQVVDVPPEVVARVRVATKRAVASGAVVQMAGKKWTACELSEGAIRFIWNGHLMVEFLPGGVARIPGCELPEMVRAAFAGWLRNYAETIS